MGGVVSGALGLAGGLFGMGSANKAAQEQANALKQALAFQQQVYGTAQTNLNPYISGGTNALSSIEGLYGLPNTTGNGATSGNALSAYKAYTQTPFYTFPLQQGTQALNQSAAARGLTLSGGQANALQQYGQNYASSNFGNYVNQLSGLANLGQSSATSLGNLGNSAATNITGIQTGIGNALAAGTMGSQFALNSALSNVGNLLNPLLGGGSFLSQNQSSYNTLGANPFLQQSDYAFSGGAGAG